MADIKRYDHEYIGDSQAYSFMEEHPYGPYVSYEDHKKIVDDLKRQLEERDTHRYR